jgi:hypothetical protein
MTEYINEKITKIEYLIEISLQICKSVVLNCFYYILLFVFYTPK